jgi:hypothetical protein
MSRRPLAATTEAVNPDSFLDIVASVVSIMIIMVVMEGSRIKNAPVSLAIASDPDQVELQHELAAEQSVRGDVLKMQEAIRQFAGLRAVRGMQRDLLATTVAAVEQKIQDHRQRLDARQRQKFDLARDLTEAKRQLNQLAQERVEAENAEPAPTKVESYPTPISRPVDNHEVHFLLTGGKIVYVPMAKLIEAFQADARRKAYKLLETPEITETLGPEGGFRLRYTLERHRTTPEEARATGRMGTLVRLRQWTLLTLGDLPGETVEECLREGSKFQTVLGTLHPGRHTITLWTYPDSFPAYRQIREELYRRGFTSAARPLPQGLPISGSPEGSKSAAQ